MDPQSSTININLQKNINLTNNNSNLSTVNTVASGTVLKAVVDKTEGNWSIFGGTQSLGTVNNRLRTSGSGHQATDGRTNTMVSVPREENEIKLVSSNRDIIECYIDQCVTKNNGTASVTFEFFSKEKTPLSSLEWAYSSNFLEKYVFGNTATSFNRVSPYILYTTTGFGLLDLPAFVTRVGPNLHKYEDNMKTVTYTFPSVTYTITVGNGNTPHVSTCTEATGITKDSATVNWSYTDDDPLDVQTQYQVQLSTKPYNDSGFTNADIVFSSSSASSVTNHTFTGLTASTTYYARIKTYNNNDTTGWSGFSSCNAGFTTSKDPDAPIPQCSCDNNRDYVCKDTAGNVTSKKENYSQCDFDSYCSVATTTTTTTFTFGPTGHRIGSVRYEHDDLTIPKNGPNYIYTHSIPIQIGKQELIVTLTDLGDNTTLIPRTCSVTNASTKVPPIVPPAFCDTAPCDTKIKITKTPRITLNKGGTCTLDWTIENRPTTGMVCTLTGTDGTSKNLPDTSGKHTSQALYQNTKYTITCTSETPAKTISASAICRINPSIGEI